MQANPDKFQAISFGKKGITDITELISDNKTIHCGDSVTLLGIEFDNMLTFISHIASMFKKAARQLAVLKRIGHLLTIKGKLAIFSSFIESNFVNYMTCCIISVTPLTGLGLSCDKRLFSIFALRYFAVRAGVGSKS